MENCNIKISIIMPVYNSGEYLQTAVESILSQNLSDFELILVDDGSTDGSSEKCDVYAKKDNRIVVLHQQNGGICAARNAGLRIARGEYIGFSDHDDEYLPRLLETAYNYAKKEDLDVVKYGHYYYFISKNNRKIKKYEVTFDEQIYNRIDISRKFITMSSAHFFTCVWDGIYRKSIIAENNFTFDTSFRFGGEDVDFMSRLMRYANSLGTIKESYYNHYIRRGISTSTKKDFSKLKMVMSYAARLQEYAKGVGIEAITKSMYADYALLITKNMISYVLNLLRNEAAKQQRVLIKNMHRDVNIDKAFFQYSSFKLMQKDFKYGLLHFLFVHKCFEMCIFMFKINKRKKE